MHAISRREEKILAGVRREIWAVEKRVAMRLNFATLWLMLHNNGFANQKIVSIPFTFACCAFLLCADQCQRSFLVLFNCLYW